MFFSYLPNILSCICQIYRQALDYFCVVQYIFFTESHSCNVHEFILMYKLFILTLNNLMQIYSKMKKRLMDNNVRIQKKKQLQSEEKTIEKFLIFYHRKQSSLTKSPRNILLLCYVLFHVS